MPSPDRDTQGGAGGASGPPKSLGGGAEAAESVHGLQENDGSAAGGDAERAGSEPLPRNREHAPSYGGAGGAPRTSSDQREPKDARGDQGHHGGAPPGGGGDGTGTPGVP